MRERVDDTRADVVDPAEGLTEGPTGSTVLGKRYRLDVVLGRGGMATVHRARDLVLDRDVAVKVFPPVHEDADDLLRNRAEMRVLATLSHPALVTLHDAGTVHDADGSQQVYLVMELVEGATLADRLREGPLTVAETAAIGRDVADALAVVHEREIVHRDIKPANILLVGGLDERRAAPVAKLADFGIARLADSTRLTMTGMTLGTVSYLSPEQATGAALGPPSDVYGLGLVLLECATGKVAFSGTPAEVATARLVSSPDVPAGLGPRLADVLARMTRMDPQERPTAREVADDLTAILALPDEDEMLPPTLAVPHADAPPTRWHVRSRRTVLAGAAGVLLAGGALTVGLLVSGDDPPEPPSYPTVEGTLGESLQRLHESVEP
ncbi:protein kinase domain-containing protein [uncultured Cellulomonas sp.]|uniref:serine/threonine-protein kinase n=1 Tax=uncultured Cellulomonas sp. TaxID=189682 RepID=UPI0028E1E98F|nr:protein kinase [uncultured Cellulomonas sp.]